MNRSGFTLIEMLVATVLSAVLTSAVLMMLASVSHDRKLLHGMNAVQSDSGVVELLRWDLTNARSLLQATDDQSLVLTGVEGIDAGSLSPNGRLVQVSYRIQSKNLWRLQEYLDSPTKAGAWQELVAVNVSSIWVDQTPRYMRLRLATGDGGIDQNLFIK